MRENLKQKSEAVFQIALLVFGVIAFGFIIGDMKIVSAEITPVGGSSETDAGAGCCLDSEEGLCSPVSSKADCLANLNGKWADDPFCNSNECSLGCCVLGLESQFVTKTRCDKLSEIYGSVSSWKGEVQDDAECIATARGQEKGACVFEEEFEEKSGCKFTSQEECLTIAQDTSAFHKDYLCSHKELDTICEKQASIGCVEDKDEIYWFDSCGNLENIYSANKDQSWNRGKVLTKEESCGSSSNNARSSTCGNCDYSKGSLCSAYKDGDPIKVEDGEFFCKDLNCDSAPMIVDAAGKVLRKRDRINGESWCVYDGPIGGLLFSQDLIGSRHFRYVCSNGEVEVEPCADYRKEICVESSSEVGSVLGGGKSSAICRVNMWEQCSSANGGIASLIASKFGAAAGQIAGMSSECSKNPDCRVQIVSVSDDFTFSMCVPNYPPGFEISSSSGSILNAVEEGLAGDLITQATPNGEGRDGEEVCAQASQTCTSLWVKKCTKGGWVCEENCECHDAIFTTQLNNLCVSLGDCGVYTNIAGKPSLRGAFVFKKGSHGKTPMQPAFMAPIYIAISKMPAVRAIAESEVFDDEPEIMDLGGLDLIDPFLGGLGGGGGGVEGSDGWQDQLGTMFEGDDGVALVATAGVAGTVSGVAFGGASATAVASGIGIPLGTSIAGGSTLTVAAGTSVTVSGLGTGGAALGTAFTASGGTAVTTAAGATTFTAGTTAATATIPAGATATAGGATTAGGSGATIASGGGFMSFAWPVIIAVVIVVVLFVLLGCGESETVEVKFSCMPSGAPPNGDCEFCNGNPKLKPCSKYRCESLGTNCQIINEGTGFDTCVDSGGESGIPMISPLEEVLNKSMYKYNAVSTNGFEIRTARGDCIQAFTPLMFGVETDIVAKCQISESRDFEEGYATPFFEGDIFTTNHTYSTYLPSVESIIYSETVAGDEVNATTYDYLLDQVGDMNFYVKCEGISGQANDQDYRINFCVDGGPDLTPPVITAHTPPTGTIVGFNATAQSMSVYVNEPADCKWDLTKQETTDMLGAYNNLTNEMDCDNDVSLGGILGFACKATLPVNATNSSYYFLCMDQPWLGENSSRNIGAQMGGFFEYNLKRSESMLKIDSIEPNGSITLGVEPATIELVVDTAGGGYEGNAFCAFSLNNGTSYTLFADTGDQVVHSQLFTSLTRGDYTIYVRCADRAFNVITGKTSFSLELDTEAPEVARVYYSSGNLILVTTEEANCYSSNNMSTGCSAKFDSGESIESGVSLVHSTEWDVYSTNYIKCKDNWGNTGGGCSIIVKPEDYFGFE